MNNLIGVDKGALTLAINVLKRAKKEEVAYALEETCVDISDHDVRLAEAQILGFNHGTHNEGFISLIDSMGLTKSEFKQIVSDFPSTMSGDQINELEEYFAKKLEAQHV